MKLMLCMSPFIKHNFRPFLESNIIAVAIILDIGVHFDFFEWPKW